MHSKAKTVPEYLQSLPRDRQQVMIEIRKAIKNNLPDGFEETMNYGMIGYVIPQLKINTMLKMKRCRALALK